MIQKCSPVSAAVVSRTCHRTCHCSYHRKNTGTSEAECRRLFTADDPADSQPPPQARVQPGRAFFRNGLLQHFGLMFLSLYYIIDEKIPEVSVYWQKYQDFILLIFLACSVILNGFKRSGTRPPALYHSGSKGINPARILVLHRTHFAVHQIHLPG